MPSARREACPPKPVSQGAGGGMSLPGRNMLSTPHAPEQKHSRHQEGGPEETTGKAGRDKPVDFKSAIAHL